MRAERTAVSAMGQRRSKFRWHRHIDGAYLSSHTANGYLHWDSDSGLTWDVRANLDTFTLAEHLTIAPVLESGAFDLRSFRIGIDAAASEHLALTDMAPLSAGTVPDSPPS